MQIPTTFKRTSLLIVLCTTFSFSTSFISGNKDKQGPDDPVKLVYIFDQSKSIPYFSAIKVTQTMEVNGQTVHNLVENYLAFKVNLLGSAADTLNLGIKVDSLFTKVETMEGTTGGKIKEVMGKTFNMILSPRGKEINIDEAKKIEYPVEGSPNANISTFFANIFPDLPEKAVKPGDTWTGNDTIIIITPASKTIQFIQGLSKFEGIEALNGLECAKITTEVTGTSQINVQNMGMDILIRGPFKGTVTLYFAIKEGYFVSEESSARMNGTVEISSPQTMSFPIVMETTSKIEIKN